MTLVTKSLNGGQKSVPDEALEALRGALRGSALLPGEPGYDDARTIWNAMVDRKPSLVVRALGANDIRQAVNFARDNELLMSVRSGGHQIAGHAVVDGAMMLDLSLMKSVHVDPRSRTARAEPGATLGDLDRETQAHALAVPVGINSTTGIAGLTLGGGFGWITRKHGMTIDNLKSADMVLANGDMVRASNSEHPDLFWAIRGGGGNFGVVTSFEFEAKPVGPEVLSGLIVHPFEDAPALLREYRRIAREAPDELTIWTVSRKAPPLPFLPEEWHGKEIFVFAACYCGDMKEGEKALEELRSLGNPIADVISPHPFVGWQTAFDPLLTPGSRNYWKSHDFVDIPDGFIDILTKAIHALPDPGCEIFVAHLGGAMARVADDATAFPQRKSHYTMNVHTRWEDPAKDEACIRWARDFFKAAEPYSVGSVYVNFMPDDETDRVGGAYGGNMMRLADIKAKYDPKNLFRVNHNIPPHAMSHAAE
ncbi:FAD-binding protein [Stappia sp. GBMRC 2046]|uniref:FAD-binding protein n=1 Tax=Stappia sediminis TaxID=2692190 RepID=A0A7X3LTM0_9HYPH|nr:FAD-binding oxidoreductase [Stappia sediminis]MXN64895.1 FAD-binding protein [Stappia sediminis]